MTPVGAIEEVGMRFGGVIGQPEGRLTTRTCSLDNVHFLPEALLGGESKLLVRTVLSNGGTSRERSSRGRALGGDGTWDGGSYGGGVEVTNEGNSAGEADGRAG